MSTVLSVIFFILGVAAAYTGMPWLASGTLYVGSAFFSVFDWQVAS